MLTLAGDYTNDVIGLHEEALDPRLDSAALMGLARAATRAETRLARLLVLAAEHCRDSAVSDVPFAIRSNMKTVSRCRSAICRLALTAEQQATASNSPRSADAPIDRRGGRSPVTDRPL